VTLDKVQIISHPTVVVAAFFFVELLDRQRNAHNPRWRPAQSPPPPPDSYISVMLKGHGNVAVHGGDCAGRMTYCWGGGRGVENRVTR
jgi:hypothetical protein